MRERPLHADCHVILLAIHIPAVAVEPRGLLCPSSDPALQDVEDLTNTRSRILTLSSISTS